MVFDGVLWLHPVLFMPLMYPDPVYASQELSVYCSRGDQESHAGSLGTEEVALLLTSVPDRAAASDLQALQPAPFARQVSGILLLCGAVTGFACIQCTVL